MTRWFRTFFVGGVIAYRGLFNWIRPAMYIPTMLGSPLFQLIFFTKLGQYAHAESRDFYIVGNAVQVCAMSSVYGMTMAVANERWYGTLGPLLASPANRAAVFLGRGVPVLANGLIVSAFTFGAGALFLGFRPGLDALPALAAIVAVTVASCTVLRDAARVDRAAREGLLLRREPRLLPDAALLRRQHPARPATRLDELVGRCLPLTHGIAAAREVAAGASLGHVAGLVWTEAAIAVAYAVAAFGLFRLLERESRRTAVLDAY